MLDRVKLTAIAAILFVGCSMQTLDESSGHTIDLVGQAAVADEDAGTEFETPVGRARGKAGSIEGTRTWIVPDTANGLRSNNSWFAVAGAPDGSIYASGCDHRTNSALFRLRRGSDVLSYVGDARSASERANNWLEGETAEKFHVRPLWYQGRVYTATADYSNQDDLYLDRRGFHWYAYDVREREFLDLSASEPSGVGAEHISIFSTALDEARGLLYGLGSPTGHLYQYDIEAGTTRDLGRPPELTRQYYNPGRFLWVDSRGAVYFTVGTAGTLAPGEPATPLHVLSWEPAHGFVSKPDWAIVEMLRTGQWSLDRKRLYILDYKLNLFVYDDAANTFQKLAAATLEEQHISPRTKGIRVRSTNLSASGRKLYFVNDTAPVNSLFEWEFAAGTPPRELARVQAIDPGLDERYTAFTGHDSWDLDGKFYFTGFGGEGVPPSPNLYLVSVDPVRLKAALGLLPGVPRVSLLRGQLVRTGALTSALEVIVETTTPANSSRSYNTVSIPSGARTAELPEAARGARRRVVPDGDTYLVR